jgi:general transcription factor 3C polypeptide 5 (transcription factor C subunit 1)
MADIQYHPYPDSKFAAKFSKAFTGLNCIPPDGSKVDEKLSKFEINVQDDDPEHPDLMPPPIFSRTVIPQNYNYKQNTGLIAINGRLAYRNLVRNKFITMVDKDAPIPEGPSSHLDPLESTQKVMQLCITRLRELFAERPIQTRRTIFNTYIDRYGPGNTDIPNENWRPQLRFALPYVCYMFKSGPFRDSYVVHGLDPRKDSKFAQYQCANFNFRTGRWRNKGRSQDDLLVEGNTSHIFTGKDLHPKVVYYSLCDIMDPLLRKLLDESPLREKFHVCSK